MINQDIQWLDVSVNDIDAMNCINEWITILEAFGCLDEFVFEKLKWLWVLFLNLEFWCLVIPRGNISVLAIVHDDIYFIILFVLKDFIGFCDIFMVW